MKVGAKIALLAGVVMVVAVMATQARRIRQLADKLGAKWTNLHPEFRRRLERVIIDLAAEGVAVGIPGTGGWRSIAAQNDIPDANTNAKDPRDSYHTWGLAADLWPVDARGSILIDTPASAPVWQVIGRVAKAHGLEWGGDWISLRDMPHVQLAGVSLARLKANYSDPLAFVTEHAADPGMPRLA